MTEAVMRSLFLIPLILLATAARAGGPERFRVDLRGTMDDIGRSGVLTFERTATVTRWYLVCEDASPGRRPRRHAWSGTAPAETDWVMGVLDSPGGGGTFTLALRPNARLWMTSLAGCPATVRFPALRRLR